MLGLESLLSFSQTLWAIGVSIQKSQFPFVPFSFQKDSHFVTQ